MNTVISEPIASFAETARGFCLWCESRSLEAGREVTAAMWLASLHANALRLPKATSNNSNGLPDIPQELLSHAKRNLANFDGYYYREYFDPNPTLNEESVIGDVGDDLLDTYKDIRAGLILFDRGESSEALWHWSFLHQVHWGRHAVGAMFALHCMQTSEQD